MTCAFQVPPGLITINNPFKEPCNTLASKMAAWSLYFVFGCLMTWESARTGQSIAFLVSRLDLSKPTITFPILDSTLEIQWPAMLESVSTGFSAFLHNNMCHYRDPALRNAPPVLHRNIPYASGPPATAVNAELGSHNQSATTAVGTAPASGPAGPTARPKRSREGRDDFFRQRAQRQRSAGSASSRLAPRTPQPAQPAAPVPPIPGTPADPLALLNAMWPFFMQAAGRTTDTPAAPPATTTAAAMPTPAAAAPPPNQCLDMDGQPLDEDMLRGDA